MFSLSYLPTAERLTIVIVKARNLRWSESKDSGGTYCSCVKHNIIYDPCYALHNVELS